MSLDLPVKEIYGVGPKLASRLKILGIEKLQDLIFYYPFRFEDYSKVINIAEIQPDEPMTILGKIKILNSKRSRFQRKNLTEALVEDDTGSIQVVWFNQPYIKNTLKVNDKVFFSGQASLRFDTLQLVSPIFEKKTENNVHTARIIPIYPSTAGITQKQLRYLISIALKHLDKLKDLIPKELLEQLELLEIKKALKIIHYPKDSKQLEPALDRLKFDELFLIQFLSQQLKNQLAKNKSYQIKFKQKQTKAFVDSLPFDLTDAQKKCSWRILQDLEKIEPMNRLLEGDVGSGKTAVAAIICLNVCLNNKQAVVMAPTEILASQHLKNFLDYFKDFDFEIAILTRTEKKIYKKGKEIECKKKEFYEKISSGEVKLIIGTHALIQDKVEFKNLALVIVDEQHRFGVKQRQNLKQKNKSKVFPHFLSMTATPIPRSLVLTIYGDLDLSIIDQMPSGRKPIISKLVKDSNRDRAYDFIKDKVKQGRQVFVICPLIDESDKLGVKAVTTVYNQLTNEIFPDFKTQMLHGKLKADIKEQIMQDFKNKKTDILVSTSVIEVGIDVPNASIMLIEGADRFGLAQLHQFRGRVGRGEHQSYCLVFTDNTKPDVISRLEEFCSCTDGFKLAEKDLQRRGPGEVYGAKQSGIPELKIAKLTDYVLIEKAKNTAKLIFEKHYSDDLVKQIRQKCEKHNLVFHLE